MLLSRHCQVFHDIINKPPIYNPYTIIFVEQPTFNCLHTCEDKWLNKVIAQMNVQSMIYRVK